MDRDPTADEAILASLKKGDPLVVISMNPRDERPRRRTVISIGPVWVTDNKGLKYSVETGEERQHFGYQDRALTVPQYQDRCERNRLRGILARWGMDPGRLVPSPENELTLAQMRLVAVLLQGFEGGKEHD